MPSSEIPRSEDELTDIANKHMTPEQQFASALHERSVKAFGADVPHIDIEDLPREGAIFHVDAKGLHIDIKKEYKETQRTPDNVSTVTIFTYSGTIDGMPLQEADAMKLYKLYNAVPRAEYMKDKEEEARQSVGATAVEARPDAYNEAMKKLLG